MTAAAVVRSARIGRAVSPYRRRAASSGTFALVLIAALDTPVLTVDLEAVERNITRTQGYCDEHGIALRPHVKTHKLPQIARLQVDAGARGITCQKLGEAEVFADAGFDDILISFPLIGAAKVDRLRALAERVRVTVTVDSPEGADAVAGLDVTALVECDTGGGRTGVQSPADAARLAATTNGFRGFLTYPTPPGTAAWLRRAIDLVQGVECVSVGGTPTAMHAHELGLATELRVGTYVYGDRACIANGSVPLEDCALRVLATVVSTPTAERAILDAGSKALTSDLAVGTEGHGYLVEYPEAQVVRLNEEHGIVDVSRCARRPRVGDRVSVIPNHACGATNLYDEVVVHRSGEIVDTLLIAARGRLR
jgi:D-serine deaminase-like pyridoxal phosphate-dependent protein